jgi:hypothetical protein
MLWTYVDCTTHGYLRHRPRVATPQQQQLILTTYAASNTYIRAKYATAAEECALLRMRVGLNRTCLKGPLAGIPTRHRDSDLPKRVTPLGGASSIVVPSWSYYLFGTKATAAQFSIQMRKTSSGRCVGLTTHSSLQGPLDTDRP